MATAVDSTVAGSIASSRGSAAKRMGRKGFELGKVALIFAAGLNLFSDAYVNAISGTVNTILINYLYVNEDAGLKKWFSSTFSSVAFAGTIVGICSAGVVADVVGRRIGMLLSCVWLALFSILAAGAWGAGGTVPGLFTALIAYRFLLGIGIGFEYPSSSVPASENAEAEGVAKNRQQLLFVLATNTALDFGFAIAAFVPLVLLWIAGQSFTGLTVVWRVSLGLGAVVPLVLLPFRTCVKEPEAYMKNRINYKKMPWWLIIKRYWLRLIGLSTCWFIYNWTVYPSGAFASLILDRLIGSDDLYKTLGWNTFLNVFYVIGTLFGVGFIEIIGPKACFLTGLICQSIIAFGLAGGFLTISQNIGGFTVMYGLFLAFGEFGAGNNLGLLASKAVAPTAVRGLFYSFAAAIGKVGAFAGTYAFGSITASFSTYPNGEVLQTTGPFYISGGLALLSATILYLTIPKVEADFMKREDLAFIRYLEENGCDVRELGLTPSAELEREAGAEKDATDEESSAIEPTSSKEEQRKESAQDAGVVTSTHELKA